MVARYRRLLRKSVAAMVAAVEIYNKPDFKYREETFSILAMNAWELLLKSFVLHCSGNRPSALYVRERRTLKDGTKSKRTYLKKNRSGNSLTIGWRKTLDTIESKKWHHFHNAVPTNLVALQEIRDNSLHLSNDSRGIAEIVQQLGSASVSNYVKLIREWFGDDLREYDFYLMPLAFFRGTSPATMIHLNSDEMRVVDTIAALSEDSGPNQGEYRVLLEMEVRLKSTTDPSAVRLARGTDKDAIPVFLKEEDIRERYPWDFKELTSRLRQRYKNFKANSTYHAIRQPLEDDTRYAIRRFLDPGNLRSSKKILYAPAILNEFDKHYTKGNSSRHGKGRPHHQGRPVLRRSS